jgi:hypothetical protein
MGLDCMQLLVVPRIVALVITLPLLTFFADMMGLAGGAVVSHFLLGVQPAQYLIFVRQAVDLRLADCAVPQIDTQKSGSALHVVSRLTSSFLHDGSSLASHARHRSVSRWIGKSRSTQLASRFKASLPSYAAASLSPCRLFWAVASNAIATMSFWHTRRTRRAATVSQLVRRAVLGHNPGKRSQISLGYSVTSMLSALVPISRMIVAVGRFCR